jgi:glutamate-1-semialdehyde 2,1-aminomutase
MKEVTSDSLEALFTGQSKTSQSLIEEAKKVMPGGDTRASAHYFPYPLFMERGEGCHLFDEDGHEIIDFMNNFTSLIHGHAFAPVVKAVTEQVARGSAFAAPTRSQVDLAALLIDRVPSLEQMRFCSSGSEATLMGLRCARAFTGRDKIMKMEGGYHGSYEQAEVSLVPFAEAAGQLNRPVSLPVDASIPKSVLEDTVVAPYNQPDIALRLIEEHADQLAAVIVEPMLGSMGMVPASKEFLQALRTATDKHGIILIFDEVITLRIGEGGMQSLSGVTPDLTSLGKIIGGGLPAGAIGGRRDLMQIFNPERPGAVFHASTFSGNALTMAAGLAAMTAFDQAEADRLNGLGQSLRDGINKAFRDNAIRGQALGAGSLSNVLFSDAPITHARQSVDTFIEAGDITKLFHLGLIRRGVMSASRLMFAISTPMGQKQIDTCIEAVHDTLQELRPVIEKETPSLLA